MKKIAFLILLLSFSFGFAQNEALFNRATELYNDAEYAAAIDNYKQILDNGQHSASLYFNLGNCYYKLNAIGPSIYYYEKALLLSPNNEEIRNNLAFAQNMRLDAIEEMPKTEMSRIYNSVIGMFTSDQWSYLAIALVFLFVLAYMAYYFLRPANQKRAAFISSMLSLVLCLVCILLAYLNHQQNKNDDPAIIFAKEVNVNAEPNVNSSTAFTLHEGTKVNVLDELDEWRRIRIADGQTGWLQVDSIKKIKEFQTKNPFACPEFLILDKIDVFVKTLLFPMISLLLIFALSVSPIIPLLDKESGKTIVIGAAEEEKSSKTFTIKKFDEADTFYKYFFDSHNQHFSLDSSLGYLGYIFPFSDYTVEILDPPPRNLV